MRIGWVCAAMWVLSAVAVAQKAAPASVDSEEAEQHELKPHRRNIPAEGATAGFNQLHLSLTVSPLGDVIAAEAEGDKDSQAFWPKVQGEVWQWKFRPFEVNGHAVTAKVEEYINIVPPERLPQTHVTSPELKPDSQVQITLERSGCFGSCPSYTVTVSTSGIAFDGKGFVVAEGKHVAPIDADRVRELAKKFIAADFYSMDTDYQANVTDMPGYALKISVDGKSKSVGDYVGSWVGMPGVISELEDDVDDLAHTNQWIKGEEGLVARLKEEKYNFQTFDAQVMLKRAAQNGQAQTVSELLAAGVGLKPLPAPKPKEAGMENLFEHVGWLQTAAGSADTLKVLIAAGASSEDQSDKDLALDKAASHGDLDSVRALITYGANPNVDMRKLIVTNSGGGMTMQGNGSGSILISAAHSGNPELIREILSFHPKLELRDNQGSTALIAAADYRDTDKNGARAECIRLLAAAGANVRARNTDGNTALHETLDTDVGETLIELGADVNAKNNDGETPLMRTYDQDLFVVLLRHGADPNLRNNKGQTALEAAANDESRAQALAKAIAQVQQEKAAVER